MKLLDQIVLRIFHLYSWQSDIVSREKTGLSDEVHTVINWKLRIKIYSDNLWFYF